MTPGKARKKRIGIAVFVCPIIASLTLTSCDQTTSTETRGEGGSLSDPSIQPTVTFTLPKDGGVGPFNVFNEGEGSQRPHFAVQFNKYMDEYSFGDSTVTCWGFDEPVLVRLRNQPYIYRLQKAAFRELLEFDVFSTYYGKISYTIGRKYTVTIDTSMKDINGNRLPHRFQFSFTPEPSFRIVGVTPSGGSTGVSVSDYVYVTFNSALPLSIVPSLSISPSVIGDWDLQSGARGVVRFTHNDPFSFNTTYTVSVAEGAEDASGNALPSQFQSRFTTNSFRVLDTSPRPGGTSVELATSVYFILSGAVDTSTVRRSFDISPPVSGRLEIYFPEMILFYPATCYKSNTVYSVTLSTDLKAQDGTSIDAPYILTFTTDTFRRTYNYPPNGSTDVYRYSTVTIDFNGPLDPATVQQAFQITPSVSGTLSASSYSIYFYPSGQLAATTTYTVTVGNSLKTLAGDSLQIPVSFSFTTGQ